MKKVKILKFCDIKGNVLLEKKVSSLPLKEQTIIKKSIEFFNDPEPCMIHRSAVMKRFFIELECFLENAMLTNVFEIKYAYLPKSLKEYLDLPSKVFKVVITS